MHCGTVTEDQFDETFIKNESAMWSIRKKNKDKSEVTVQYFAYVLVSFNPTNLPEMPDSYQLLERIQTSHNASRYYHNLLQMHNKGSYCKLCYKITAIVYSAHANIPTMITSGVESNVPTKASEEFFWIRDWQRENAWLSGLKLNPQ